MHSNVKTMRIKQGYKIREIAGEKIIVIQGKYGEDMTKIVSLNPSAELLVRELSGREFEIADAAGILTDNYEVDYRTAERDASAWAEKLIECGIIES